MESAAALLASLTDELSVLLPAGSTVIDAHTHLGDDEDGHSQDLPSLLGQLDALGPNTRACVFPLHDPDRHPAYRRPNDRVLDWAADSGGRLAPYCRLDPGDDPIGEAERCLKRGAKGIKLHPRAQGFGFGNAAADRIFATARDAQVPILIHAGRGMPPMDPLAELALRYPDVTLVLAHAGIAGQGMFATRLAGHQSVLYDTSAFSAVDVVELFARVPAERIVFASDSPYGHPFPALYTALRAATRAGVDAAGRELIAGGTMRAVLERRPLPEPTAPRLEQLRPVNGRLQRVGGYLMMAMGAALTATPPDLSRAQEGIELARYVCRDPEPGDAGPALERIDSSLAVAQSALTGSPELESAAVALAMAAAAIAATEPLGGQAAEDDVRDQRAVASA